MNELQRLKRRLFKQEPSEQEQVYSLCAVMDICGGYEQLLNLPMPSLKHILKYLEEIRKQTDKNMPKKPHLKRK